MKQDITKELKLMPRYDLANIDVTLDDNILKVIQYEYNIYIKLNKKTKSTNNIGENKIYDSFMKIFNKKNTISTNEYIINDIEDIIDFYLEIRNYIPISKYTNIIDTNLDIDSILDINNLIKLRFWYKENCIKQEIIFTEQKITLKEIENYHKQSFADDFSDNYIIDDESFFKIYKILKILGININKESIDDYIENKIKYYTNLEIEQRKQKLFKCVSCVANIPDVSALGCDSTGICNYGESIIDWYTKHYGTEPTTEWLENHNIDTTGIQGYCNLTDPLQCIGMELGDKCSCCLCCSCCSNENMILCAKKTMSQTNLEIFFRTIKSKIRGILLIITTNSLEEIEELLNDKVRKIIDEGYFNPCCICKTKIPSDMIKKNEETVEEVVKVDDEDDENKQVNLKSSCFDCFRSEYPYTEITSHSSKSKIEKENMIDPTMVELMKRGKKYIKYKEKYLKYKNN